MFQKSSLVSCHSHQKHYDLILSAAVIFFFPLPRQYEYQQLCESYGSRELPLPALLCASQLAQNREAETPTTYFWGGAPSTAACARP